jgi:hypothetical protein
LTIWARAADLFPPPPGVDGIKISAKSAQKAQFLRYACAFNGVTLSNFRPPFFKPSLFFTFL